jgi:inorganic pyrophosphatase
LPVRTPDLAPIQFASPQLIHIAQHADPQQVKAAAAVGALVLFFLAVRTAWTAVFVMLACFASLAFAVYLAKWVLAKDEGTADMQEVSDAIREGADGFFATQYNLIGKLAGVVAIAIYLIYSARALTKEQMDAGIGQQTFAVLTTFSFCTGALASAASGYVGMWVSVRANVRVAGAARRSSREALLVALRAGGFAAILVVASATAGVASLYAVFAWLYGVSSSGTSGTSGTETDGASIHDIPLMLVGYGFGASFVALFAQLGGGIYTKAADVGADLVGKGRGGHPGGRPAEPRGDRGPRRGQRRGLQARGADLFESIAAEVISAMILGGSMARRRPACRRASPRDSSRSRSSCTRWTASSPRSGSCRYRERAAVAETETETTETGTPKTRTKF